MLCICCGSPIFISDGSSTSNFGLLCCFCNFKFHFFVLFSSIFNTCSALRGAGADSNRHKMDKVAMLKFTLNFNLESPVNLHVFGLLKEAGENRHIHTERRQPAEGLKRGTFLLQRAANSRLSHLLPFSRCSCMFTVCLRSRFSSE